jgi:hypothetical protein
MWPPMVWSSRFSTLYFFKETVDRVGDVGNPHYFCGSKHLHGPLNATSP